MPQDEDRKPRTVLLATDGRRPLSPEAIERAAALASPGGVAVLAIAKIYGTQFGLPHPGLMPTKDEVDLRRGWIADAIQALERRGVEAESFGQHCPAVFDRAWLLLLLVDANIKRSKSCARGGDC